MRVAIVENTAVTHHGQVGVALHERGALIDQYKPWHDNNLPDIDAADALVVFGGEQDAMADATHPYLAGLARLMAAFTAADKPVLGICLGAQILARAYGATNHLGTAREFGWVRVALTAAGREDPVLGNSGPDFPIFQWHSDTFTLPSAAVHLATSDSAAAQAFRVGRATYGMQFHFEASRAVVADWTRRFPAATTAMQDGWLHDHPVLAAELGPQADRAGLQIARNWVNLIRS
jgi:GMP synthase (glutamine-hydrolysing)